MSHFYVRVEKTLKVWCVYVCTPDGKRSRSTTLSFFKTKTQAEKYAIKYSNETNIPIYEVQN